MSYFDRQADPRLSVLKGKKDKIALWQNRHGEGSGDSSGEVMELLRLARGLSGSTRDEALQVLRTAQRKEQGVPGLRAAIRAELATGGYSKETRAFFRTKSLARKPVAILEESE